MDEMLDWLADQPPVESFEERQRVRIISYLGGPVARAVWIGREGTVLGRTIMTGIWSGQVGYWVEVRGVGTTLLPGSALESVHPEGARPGNWKDSPWQPPA